MAKTVKNKDESQFIRAESEISKAVSGYKRMFGCSYISIFFINNDIYCYPGNHPVIEDREKGMSYKSIRILDLSDTKNLDITAIAADAINKAKRDKTLQKKLEIELKEDNEAQERLDELINIYTENEKELQLLKGIRDSLLSQQQILITKNSALIERVKNK